MHVCDRIQHIISRIDNGENDPDVALAYSRKFTPYLESVHRALLGSLHQLEASPLDYSKVIRLGGVGRILMEDLLWTEGTSLGQEIINTCNDISMKYSIEQALVVLSSMNIEKYPAIPRVIHLLYEMKCQFDEAWKPSSRMNSIRMKLQALFEKDKDARALYNDEVARRFFYLIC